MRPIPILTVVVMTAAACLAQGEKPLLLQSPALSKTQIVFAHAGDLWIVARDGGEAKRLTSGVGLEGGPVFSPDGTQVAFTGEYDGNVDVFVVPALGGVPRRLTYHPGADRAAGWTRDGKQVLLVSPRHSYSRFARLFTMPLDGAFPVEIPLPQAEEGSYSPDGSRLAYVPIARMFRTWKRYRGGTTTPIWIARLSDSTVEKVPRQNSNDFNPMWVDNRVFFLSDRNGPVTLFSYDTTTKKVDQVIANTGLDFKAASAGPGAIAYEQFGAVHHDLQKRQSRKLDIRVSGDMPEVRARLEKVDRRITRAGLSPTGARAVFEARGEILTVPAEKGDVRNLTNTPAVAERDPSWSPDGQRIAYYSDESGEYMLHIRDQSGRGEARKISLGNRPSFYYTAAWSPDSKKIAYADKTLNVWYLDLEKGAPVKVDTDIFDGPRRIQSPSWSPDSRWLAYTRQLRNSIRAVFVYSLETGQRRQITDGMSDASQPAWDRDGKHLYFTASTDFGLTVGWRDMSGFDRPVTRSVYVVVLRKDLPSPLAPESDEEKPAEEKKPEEKKPEAGSQKPGAKPETVSAKIDFEDIEQRILALPIPARDYVRLMAGKSGTLFLVETPFTTGLAAGPGGGILHKFDLKTRKTDKVLENAFGFIVSANGEKMLFRQSERWLISAAGQAPKPGEGALKLDGMEVRVEPRAEWRQMYREAWRIQRDFFYDPGLHGLDLEAAMKRYEPYLENVSSRGDLNYLFAEMMGELTASHLSVGGGSAPEVKRVSGGLLGADFRIENGRYRFARIYGGESWNPQLRAPLTQPGVNVVSGEYLLAVNGRDLRASDNIYSFLEATAGKAVTLKVGSDPSGAGSRDVTVTPVDNEYRLRNLAWVEGNRRKVDQMSGGRLAYVYLPDTAGGGYTNFNRYYFAQTDKEGAVIDERFNGGGAQADYIIDYMRRPLLSYRTTREGEDFKAPLGAIFGPKAMIINEYAGSGGDALPFYFRKTKIGPLIGKTTWGGLVGGLGGWPILMDGGVVSPPSVGFWNPGGSWEVENFGIAPDIEIEQDPSAMRAGRDPQLEKTVEVLMEELRKNPPPTYTRPPFPRYHPERRTTPTTGNQAARNVPPPDLANVRYGPHERNVLDLWKAKSDRPAPLVVFIHGGGFRAGDKNNINATLLEESLKAGISVAAINYRLSHQAAYPAFMHDSARAIQFLRWKAKEFNIDPKRVAATGGSAGAGISLWVGFHDDLADSSSDDPVKRQSTRLTAMGVFGAQSSYDPRFIAKHIGEAAAKHPALGPFYGLTESEHNTERAHRMFEDASPITHLSAGDPPVFMFYAEPKGPLPPDAKPGQGIHHPNFGFILKEKMDRLGIESEIRHRDDYAGDAVVQANRQMVEFFRRHFRK